ncbi:MAG: TnpV protein [Solirubrobacteraceae bacterium]
MNKYGRMAIRHWEKTDPDRFQQIPESDRETFFTEVGERAELEIQQLQDQLAGPDPAGESYLEKVGRLNMARLQAEDKVLPELILIPAPSQDEKDEGNESARWHLETQRARARERQQDE